LSLARRCDRSRTLMRHARPTSSSPIGPLALAMILLAYRGCLISATGFLQLLLSHPLPASVTAMALAAITTRTDGEKPGRMRTTHAGEVSVGGVRCARCVQFLERLPEGRPYRVIGELPAAPKRNGNPGVAQTPGASSEDRIAPSCADLD